MWDWSGNLKLWSITFLHPRFWASWVVRWQRLRHARLAIPGQGVLALDSDIGIVVSQVSLLNMTIIFCLSGIGSCFVSKPSNV